MGGDASGIEELTEIQLLRELAAEHLLAIADVTERLILGDGSELSRQGRRSEDCYLLVRGRASIWQDDELAGAIGAGEVVGELALLDECHRSATITVDGVAEVLRIDGPAFRRLLRARPAMSSALLGSLASRLRTMYRAAGGPAVD